jgi:transketolase
MSFNSTIAPPERAARPSGPPETPSLSPACLDDARRRLLQMHWDSGIGHLGGNLSALDAMMVLHHELIGPHDRFILSKGHSAGAYYVTLWSLGILTEADLYSFHRDGTRLAGHPPAHGLPGILFSTGSLGHGLSLAAGLALAAQLQGRRQGRVFCLTSDGEWQEGSTFEALIFAAHRNLANLTILVDHNGLQGFGTTAEVASMDPLGDRLAGFDVDLRECDGHDIGSLRAALSPPCNRPAVVIMRTIKGRGVPGLEGRMESHYLPLTEATTRPLWPGSGHLHEGATLRRPDGARRSAGHGVPDRRSRLHGAGAAARPSRRPLHQLRHRRAEHGRGRCRPGP